MLATLRNAESAISNQPASSGYGSSSRVIQRRAARLHAGDQLLHPLVDRAERVLAEHRPLRLVVELEVHPVHGEVAPPLLRPPDKLAAQPRAGGLRRHGLGLEDVQIAADPLDRAPLLQQVVEATAAV